MKKWYVYTRHGKILGPFKTKHESILYTEYCITGKIKRFSKGHYENQYGEIVATKKNMEALGMDKHNI